VDVWAGCPVNVNDRRLVKKSNCGLPELDTGGAIGELGGKITNKAVISYTSFSALHNRVMAQTHG